MKKTAPTAIQVISRDQAHALHPGCHPSVTDSIHIPAGIPTPIPAEALPFVLSLPGVEALDADPPEPAITEE